MEKTAGVSRMFLIKHKDCGCMIVKSNEIVERFGRMSRDDRPITCPTCGKEWIEWKSIGTFLQEYHKLISELAKENFTITEIPQGDLDYKSLWKFLTP